MNEFPAIKQMGEKSFLIDFQPVIEENLLFDLLNLKEKIQKNNIEASVEVINAFNSLLVIYDSPIEDVYGEKMKLKSCIGKAKIQEKRKTQLFHIPVSYDDKFGLDLQYISQAKSLSINEIISLHTAPFYTVFFIGFLPGFLYLGGLDKRLQISRRNKPRLEVPKGAVGIGENQTGIYPQTSPGGWQIIGNSPVPLFNPQQDPPCEISAGDKLKFYPVSLEEHKIISEEVKTGTFSFKKELYG